jgi:hypothetical protein
MLFGSSISFVGVVEYVDDGRLEDQLKVLIRLNALDQDESFRLGAIVLARRFSFPLEASLLLFSILG